MQKAKANNVVAMAREHPVLHRRVVDLLSHVGVDFPPEPGDPEVRSLVVQQIQSRYQLDDSRLNNLIDALDAPVFEAREAERRKLRHGHAALAGLGRRPSEEQFKKTRLNPHDRGNESKGDSRSIQPPC